MKTYLPLLAGSFLLLVSWSAPGASPIPTTLMARNITADQATLRGRANPKFAVTAFFEWGLTANYGNVSATQTVARAGFPVGVKQGLTNLTPATPFHFRVVTSNGRQLYYGPDRLFMSAPSAPLVTTESAEAVTPVQATLHGTVDPNGRATSVYFQWGPTTNYENRTAAQSVGNGAAAVPVQQEIGGLTPGANYHFRLVARNPLGLRYGADAVFAAVSAPVVTTEAATDVQGRAGLLHATVNPGALDTTAVFEWGLTTSYGNRTTPIDLPAGTNGVAVQALLASLRPGATYHFRAVATNRAGTRAGADLIFSLPCEANSIVAILPECSEVSLLTAISAASRVVFACDGTITLTSPIEVNCALVLDGSGQNVTLSGGHATRLFNVHPGASLTLRNLTIANGRTQGANGSPGSGSPGFGGIPPQGGESVAGGGLSVSGASLYAGNCIFSNCAAVGGWGGNAQQPMGGSGGPAGNASGGVISASGSSVVLSNCLFVGNTAAAGLSGQGAFVHNSTRSVGSGVGGGLSASQSSVTLIGCTFQRNASTTAGGAVYNYDSLVSATHSVFSANSAGPPPAFSTASGGAIFQATGTLMIASCSFESNSAAGSHSYGTFAYSIDAASAFGGGLAVKAGSVVVERSAFLANRAVGGNGGSQPNGVFYGFPGEGLGGALYSHATVTVTNSTFVANQAASGTGYAAGANFITSAGRGGALASDAGSLQVFFSTIASNAAVSGANTASNAYGGGWYNNGAVATVGSSILAGNWVNQQSSNFYGMVTDVGHNLSSDATPAWTSGLSLNYTDPLLLPLADHGGPTWTMALRLGSPALDAADCASSPATDQRGAARPDGPGCDIGAYEGPGVPAVQF